MEGGNIIMPLCVCANEIYDSVCVCVSVDCYSCSGINELQVRDSSKIMLRSFSSYVVCLFGQWNAIAVFSEERVANLVHGVLLLYLVVSSVLECYY